MIIYWSLLLASMAASFTSFIKNTKILRWAIYSSFFIALIFLAGFRFESIDYFSYQDLFNDTNLTDFSIPFFTTSLGTTGMEFIWASFSSLFKNMGLSFEVWLFFVAFISISIKFYHFKKWTPYFLFALVLYLSLWFSKDMGQIRNGLAAAILLLSVKPLVERNFWHFALIVFLAFGIQAYAIIALPLYWFYSICKKQPLFIAIGLIGLSVLSLMGGVADLVLQVAQNISYVPAGIVHKLEGYTVRSTSRITFLTYTGVVYLIFAFSILYFQRYILKLPKHFYALSVFHIYSMYLFLFFTGIDTITSRSLNLFSSSALCIVLLIPFYFMRSYSKVIYALFIILFSVLSFYKGIGDLYPYQSILF